MEIILTKLVAGILDLLVFCLVYSLGSLAIIFALAALEHFVWPRLKLVLLLAYFVAAFTTAVIIAGLFEVWDDSIKATKRILTNIRSAPTVLV